MRLQEALKTSPVETAILEYNGLYTSVDGSALDGKYTITSGRQWFPPTEYVEVASVDVALVIIQEKGFNTDEWESVPEEGEDDEPQEDEGK